MSEDLDRLIARHERGAAVPAFDAVLDRRSRRRRGIGPLVVVAALAIVVAGFAIGTVRERLATPGPSVAAVTVLTLPSGQVLASPDGQRIAVVGPTIVTVHDQGGRELQRWPGATAYARWLPDSSGLLVQTPATGSPSLLVLETDGRTTRLALAVPPAAAAYTWLSPDGGSLAADTGTTVVTLGRDGATPQAVITGADHHLLGFDRAGRVLVIDGPDARALGTGGYTVPLPTLGNPLSESGTGASPDGTVTLVAMATPVDQLIAIADHAARAIPRPTGWVGPHMFVARVGGGGIEWWDAATGDHHVISAIPNSATLHGTSGPRLLWSIAGVTHATDVSTGVDHIVSPLSVSAKAQPLAGGRFLVIDGDLREVIAPE